MIYDLIVIGGGPAGYLACERAGHAGLKTLLIEKRFLGGVCLNEGCIPSKTLLHSAKLYDYVRFSEKYGVTTAGVGFDHAKVLARKNKVVRTLVAGIRSQLKANQVDFSEGLGEIVDRTADGYRVRVNDTLQTGKRLLLATGSAPVIPPIRGVEEGLERGFVLTNREIFELKEIPKSLVVIGGGAIGLEMASYFNSAGSRVTVVEMLDHIGGELDREIASILQKNYEKKRVEFKVQARVTAVEADGITYECNGEAAFLPADKVLLSVGRAPIVSGFGLERLGVELNHGSIKVDENGKTNLPEVYAAGDVNGRSMLAHTAYREAEVCVENILGRRAVMRYDAIPSVIYTNPEVASVGVTDTGAREQGLDCVVTTVSMRYSGRYVAENEVGDGICRIVTERSNGRLRGVHMIGSYTSEMIFGAGLMIENEMRVRDIKEIVFPHPTVSEILREAVFAVE